MSENLSYSVGSPDNETSFLAVAERIAKQKRLGTDPVQNVDGSGKPLPGSVSWSRIANCAARSSSGVISFPFLRRTPTAKVMRCMAPSTCVYRVCCAPGYTKFDKPSCMIRRKRCMYG